MKLKAFETLAAKKTEPKYFLTSARDILWFRPSVAGLARDIAVVSPLMNARALPLCVVRCCSICCCDGAARSVSLFFSVFCCLLFAVRSAEPRHV